MENMLNPDEEIIKSREHAWDYISSRKHNVVKVFEGNVTNPGRDIMLQATLELGLKNGNKLDCEFGARAIIVEVEGNGDFVRLKSFVAWTVSGFSIILRFGKRCTVNGSC
jgi:hypothetical protein